MPLRVRIHPKITPEIVYFCNIQVSIRQWHAEELEVGEERWRDKFRPETMRGAGDLELKMLMMYSFIYNKDNRCLVRLHVFFREGAHFACTHNKSFRNRHS